MDSYYFLMNNLTSSQVAVLQLDLDKLKEPNPDLIEPVECSKQWASYEEKVSEIKNRMFKYLKDNKKK